MIMTSAYSALVHPASSAASQLPIKQAIVTQSGRLLDMLTDIFERAESECNIDLVFSPDTNQAQNNSCRAALMAFIRNPSFQTGEIIVRRLQSFTPPQAGVALLFLLVGANNSGHHQLVVSRFPAETGIPRTGKWADFIAFAYRASVFEERFRLQERLLRYRGYRSGVSGWAHHGSSIARHGAAGPLLGTTIPRIGTPNHRRQRNHVCRQSVRRSSKT